MFTILILILILITLLVINLWFRFNKREYFYDLKFIHIPKNAGTSIENNAYKKGILWGFKEWGKKNCETDKHPFKVFKCKGKWYNKNNNLEYDKKMPCFPWHQIPENVKHFYKNDKLFAIVRNPYTKIVSAYNYSHGKKATKKGLNKFIKNKLTDFEKNKTWNGCHILPQNEYTHGKIKVDYILKFENLDNEFNDLVKKYNINIELSNNKNNKSKSKITYKDLDNESINLINNVYDKDFQLFGYKKIY